MSMVILLASNFWRGQNQIRFHEWRASLSDAPTYVSLYHNVKSILLMQALDLHHSLTDLRHH